jgi:hypothetical protein
MSTFTHAGGSTDGIVGTTKSHDNDGVIGKNEDATARNAAKPEGNGVFGTTLVPDGAGIFGLHEGNGVGVAGFGHPTGIGVVGVSAPAGGKGGDGVLGVTNSEHRNGIVGRNDSTAARLTLEPGGNGVFGFSQVPDGAGVFGEHSALGIGVAGLGLIGVSGGSPNGVGVMGVSTPPGGAGAGDGVQGITNSALRNGIYGRNDATTEGDPENDAVGNGVLGFSNVPWCSGIRGMSGNTVGNGVFGTGGFGAIGMGSIIGVWGIAKESAWSGYFSGPVMIDGKATMSELEVSGNVAVGGNVTVTGDVTVGGDVLLPNRDIAEKFEVESGMESAPGTVMVIGESGALRPCDKCYDKRAVGVVLGAGTLRNAITLGTSTGDSLPGAKIGLVGTAYCCIDADIAPVEVGDLLTTSNTIGHGMKAVDQASSFGAIIGKALAPLRSGRGLIPVLLTLQ